MPALASLPAFAQAVADFPAGDLEVAMEPAARAAAERSVAESGFLLLGEVHGVQENPLIIGTLLQALGLTGLALEWPAELATVVRAFAGGGPLADHPALWGGDGRITAGHLAVLRERADAGPLELTLMDEIIGADWSWSQRDEAMAGRVLAEAAPGSGTLVVAGNAPPARAGRRRGSFSATKTSPSNSPPPPKRSCRNGPGRRPALDSGRDLAEPSAHGVSPLIS